MSRTHSDLSLLPLLAKGYRACGASGRSILLAVSGGADSTALLLGSVALAVQERLELEVACVDHGVRPGGRTEQAQVARLAAELGLPFHGPRLRLEAGSGFEARAREARYRALEEVRAARRVEKIATAHTADDQAETLLMRLSRGASLQGAAAILPERGAVVRPLLSWTRQDVLAFLAREDRSYAEDETNADRRLLRARIRHDVLPALDAAAGPGVAVRLARFARLAGEDAAWMGQQARMALARIRLAPGALDAVGLAALERPLRRWVLAEFLSEVGVGVDAEALERLLEGVMAGRPCPIRGDWTLRQRRGRWTLEKNPPRRSRGGTGSGRSGGSL